MTDQEIADRGARLPHTEPDHHRITYRFYCHGCYHKWTISTNTASHSQPAYCPRCATMIEGDFDVEGNGGDPPMLLVVQPYPGAQEIIKEAKDKIAKLKPITKDLI